MSGSRVCWLIGHHWGQKERVRVYEDLHDPTDLHPGRNVVVYRSDCTRCGKLKAWRV